MLRKSKKVIKIYWETITGEKRGGRRREGRKQILYLSM